jgi:hypothetical protein
VLLHERGNQSGTNDIGIFDNQYVFLAIWTYLDGNFQGFLIKIIFSMIFWNLKKSVFFGGSIWLIFKKKKLGLAP